MRIGPCNEYQANGFGRGQTILIKGKDQTKNHRESPLAAPSASRFKDRVSRNGGRLKKTTIVALARKLLVALWKYVTAGVIIEGAIVKSA